MGITHMRVAAGVALGAAVACALAACAPGATEDTGNEPSVATSGQPGAAPSVDPSQFAGETLDYLYFTDGPDQQATEDNIKAFEEKYGVTVNLEIMAYADIVTQVQARLSAGQAPDVARVANLNDLGEDLLDLTPYLGADYKDQFLPGPVSAVINSDGEMIAVPSDLTLNGVFVNVDMFKKAGIDIPTEWDWPTLIDDAKKVKEANGTPYAFIMDKSGSRVSTLLSQYDTFVVQGKKNTLDVDKATEALQPLVDLMKADDMPADFWLGGSSARYSAGLDYFLNGTVPIYLSGTWQIAGLVKNATFDWAAVPNPCATNCGGFPGGKFMGAFKESKNPALAATFVGFMNEAEQQAKFVTIGGALPTRVDLSASGVTYPDEDSRAAFDVYLADLVKTPTEGYAANGSPVFTNSANEVVDAVTHAVNGDSDLKTALTNAKTAIDSDIAAAG